jgi:hypothetical protein
METPEIHVLNRINWQFFGTLTFKSERLPERVRLAMFFAYLRQFCRQFGLKFPKLLWCLRQEQGELTGRRHFHYLIAGDAGLAGNPHDVFLAPGQMGEARRRHGESPRVRPQTQRWGVYPEAERPR